jgi:hypothetical protein
MKVLFYENGKQLLIGALAIVILLFTSIPLYAASVTLAWDKPDDDRVVGYHVYSGKSDTDFKSTPNTTIYSPDTTTCVISDVEEGFEYSFAAKSFDADGNESDFTPTLTFFVESSTDTDDDGDGITENQGDCNDADASVYPGADEICGDGIDQDCSGGDMLCPEDIDDDGDGITENQGDCNDADASVYPGADEICGDGIDQDCSGGDMPCPEDIDDDDDGITENQGDCNDADASVYPGADEICGDGIDQDCDGEDQICDGVARTVLFGDAPDADFPGTVQDTFINVNQEVNVAGDQLNTYTWPLNMPANAVLIKFDLSQLPAGAQIQSATLTLYQTEAGGDATYDVSVHKVINVNPDFDYANGYTYDSTHQWTSSDVAYNGIPLAQSDIAPAEDVNSLDQSLGYKNWDVTNMVRDWAGGSSPNYGLMLNSDSVASTSSHRFFASSETADAEKRPGLVITYSMP